MSYCFDEKRLIGKGVYGQVYQVSNETGEQHALKRNVTEDGQIFRSLRELHFLRLVKNHPSFVQLKSIVLDDLLPFEGKQECFHFTLNLAKESMEESMDREQDFTEPEMIYITSQLLLGLEFLHQRNVGHFDLKPANIVFNGDLTVQICDFGISEYWSRHHHSTRSLASPDYRAPEIAAKLPKYNGKADVWSLGCILYEMINGDRLITGEDSRSSAIFQEIINHFNLDGEDLTFFKKNKICQQNPCSIIFTRYPRLSRLASLMLTLNPERRSSATELLNHEIFNPHREYIDKIRQLFTPKIRIKIVPTEERRQFITHCLQINELMPNIACQANIIHAITLYDSFVRKNSIPDLELFAYTILFLGHMIYTNLSLYVEWWDFCSEKFTEKQLRKQIINILRKNKSYFFVESVYELSEKDQISLEELFDGFFAIDEFEGSQEEFYQQVKLRAEEVYTDID